MIKIWPKMFMITLIFCLRQHFSLMTSLIFIQNFGNYSFIWIDWKVYCLRINYHSFESYWVVLSKYQITMAPLPFIFCWRKHIFLMNIQIFIEKHFFSNFWTADPLNMVDPSFFIFLRDLHTDLHLHHPLVASKYTKNIKYGWMTLDGMFL